MRLFLALCAALFATALLARPTDYMLNASTSDSAFIYIFDGKPVRGNVPVQTADVTIDFENLANSKVSTTLSARKASAGFVFATQTMRGPKMLDAVSHPTIRFVSTSVRGRSPNATIKGNLTLRGVTRPVTLKATLFRTSQSRDNLIIQMQGTLNRNDFGMTGFPGFVAPTIKLDIKANISRR